MKIAFVLIAFILILWRIKKGFQNGMMKEVAGILSAVVSCVCIILIFYTVSSVIARTFSILTVCIAALIGIGIAYKICNLIFKPVAAITNISIIGGMDKLFGAVLGFGEALIFVWFLYHLLAYAGVLVS